MSSRCCLVSVKFSSLANRLLLLLEQLVRTRTSRGFWLVSSWLSSSEYGPSPRSRTRFSFMWQQQSSWEGPAGCCCCCCLCALLDSLFSFLAVSQKKSWQKKQNRKKFFYSQYQYNLKIKKKNSKQHLSFHKSHSYRHETSLFSSK